MPRQRGGLGKEAALGRRRVRRGGGLGEKARLDEEAASSRRWSW